MKWDSRLMASGRVMIYRDEWAMGSFSNPENAAEIVARLSAADALAVALDGLRKCLPDACNCHESYREREKALGHRFKDPDCAYCGNEAEIKQADAALTQWRAATVKESLEVQSGEKEGS